MPPIALPSFKSANVLCFLQKDNDENILVFFQIHIRVKDQSGNVLLWHSGQLVRKHILQSNEPHDCLLADRPSD
jgi:hypothetical protein